MAMWQPNYERASKAVQREIVVEGVLGYETDVHAVLSLSGALKEIERLTKALEDANNYIIAMESDANSY